MCRMPCHISCVHITRSQGGDGPARRAPRVALKKMPNAFASSTSTRRVYREILMLASLKHENVRTIPSHPLSHSSYSSSSCSTSASTSTFTHSHAHENSALVRCAYSKVLPDARAFR